MNDPKIKASSDAEWRYYYENKCRDARKEITRLELRLEDSKRTIEVLKEQIKFLAKGVSRSQKLIDAANLLHEEAERLPEGYGVSLVCQYGESSINLCDPDGEDIEVVFDGDRSHWLEAIEAAEEHAKENAKP